MAVQRISAKQLKEIVARIAYAKASVPTACEGICSVASFWRRLAEDKDLQDEYARAREVRADARFESIDGVLGNLLAGKIDAATARVMVDTIKWQAGREQPKRYAERYQVDNRLVDKDGNDRILMAEFDNAVAAAEAEGA